MADHTHVADANLANKLRPLGAEIVQTKDSFEIGGVSRDYIEYNSGRSQQILEKLEKEGLTRATASTEQKQAANLATREGKDTGEKAGPELKADWISRAKEAGFYQQGERVKEEMRERAKTWVPETREQRMDMAAEALKSASRHFSERQSVFSAKDMSTWALKAGIKNGVTEAELRQSFPEKKEVHGLLVAKSPIDPQTGAPSTERFVTTRLALARDEKMIKNLQAGKGAIAANERWTPQEIAREISAYEARKGFKLSPDQVAAIHTTLGSGDRNTTWQGVAGAGKTTAVEVVKNAYEHRGYKVLGIASGTQAVKELASIEVECKTYAMWAASGMKADDKTLFIGDETGMTGSADGARAIHTIEQNKSRGLFIGDTNQLQAVDSGSPFRIMQKECDTSTLSEIRRQKTPEMLQIATLFSEGKAAEAAQQMGQFMHPVDIGDASNYKEIDQKIADVVAQEYLSLPSGKPTENEQGVPTQTRDNTLLLVATNSMRERLNLGIREGLRVEGALGKEEVQARTLHDSKATKEELRQAHFYDGKMKDEDGKAVQIVIMPSPEIKGEGYAIHGVKYADAATQKHYLELRANAKENGLEKDAPVILAKGQEYRIQSVDLQKGEVHLTDAENREIIWKPSEAGKVQAFEEKQTAMAVNDKIIFKQNQTIQQPDGKEMKVFNGQKGVVQSVSEDKIYIKTSQGEDVAINKDGGTRIEHAYSGTVHSMQGATQDYGIAALRAGSRMNTGNSGYVGQTRFRYEIKVHTNDVAQLQKDWGKGYQYQENAIDHAQGKDLQRFNQQIEEKKMEIVEKEDSLDPKAQAQAEPEKSPAQREEKAQPEAAPAAPGKEQQAEPEKGPAPSQPEAARDTHETAPSQPETAQAAPGEKEVEDDIIFDNTPYPQAALSEHDLNPHNWQDEHGPTATKEELEKWNAEHPEHPDAQRYVADQERMEKWKAEHPEKDAERATEAAQDVIWDESVPAPTGEHEYLESSPEPIITHGQQEMGEEMLDQEARGQTDGPQAERQGHEPEREESEKPPLAIRDMPAPISLREAYDRADEAQQILNRANLEHDFGSPEFEAADRNASDALADIKQVEENMQLFSLEMKRMDAVENLHEKLTQENLDKLQAIEKAIDETTARRDGLNQAVRGDRQEPEKAEPEKGPASEKDTPQREEPAPREPERAPMPAGKDEMEKWAKALQEQERKAHLRPERGEDAARAAHNPETVLGREVVQNLRHDPTKAPQNQVKAAPTHDKAPAKQQPTQHKGHDKGMEREM